MQKPRKLVTMKTYPKVKCQNEQVEALKACAAGKPPENALTPGRAVLAEFIAELQYIISNRELMEIYNGALLRSKRNIRVIIILQKNHVEGMGSRFCCR